MSPEFADHRRSDDSAPPDERPAEGTSPPGGTGPDPTREQGLGRPAREGAGGPTVDPVGTPSWPGALPPGAPAGPYWIPALPQPQPLGRRLAVGAGALLALILLGVPLGLLWVAVSPQIPVVRTETGTVLTQPQPEEFIAADGWFSLLGFGFGVLAAIVFWLVLRRQRGPLSLLLLAVGGIGAAVVAWQVGRRIGLDEYQRLLATAPLGEQFNKPPDLRAGAFEWLYGWLPTVQGNLLLPAFGAVVTYTLLAGWSRWPDLRPELEPGPQPEPGPGPQPISWGSSVPPAPAGAPAPPEPGAAEPPRG
ncbi:hypothetical protein GCM10027280_44290 [Micromonospora polyrhachis]|uniref:DUF2567 domain-containing protein n=1 Tax=Micromonospora polyrhachis TaxID=1282883 RepID=A0A7W7SUV1_9ACTN|nr:DUF2567 domain-containing protein [Micromonospora polyrhachis]MBB4961311.1 hypothetical protein [Micromonospora polyrhachis]